MLKSNYETIIIGKNYLSLIFSILKLSKSKKSVLVIDEPDTRMGKEWYLNIGEIEKNIFKNIGITYNINTLKSFDSYLHPINTIIFLNEKMIELGTSPFANIREIARKLPECFPENSLELLEAIGVDDFNQLCFDFFQTIANQVIQNEKKLDLNTVNESLSHLFTDFLNFLNRSELISEQLYYVLQVLFQTFFSNYKTNETSQFLLLSILSPRYSIDDKSLMDDLIFEFRELGGDIVDCKIERYEIYKQELKYMMLSSVDGIIGFDECFFFSRIPSKAPFERKENEMEFDSIRLICPIEHDIIDFYKNKRILFSKVDKIGTDFPHLEIYIDENGVLNGTFSYANYIGTKPSFYYKKVAEDIFSNLAEILPGLNKDDWSHQISFTEGEDFWTENLGSRSNISSHIKYKDYLYDREEKFQIERITYFGPNRTKSMGLLSFSKDMIESIQAD